MKISNIVIALVILFAVGCTSKKTANEHGHEHGTEAHAHDHDDHQQQEEFTVDEDAVEVTTDSTTHIHEDGNLHHNH